jgi:hypothetical protein
MLTIRKIGVLCRREIDFIVRQPAATLLIEAKLTFPHGIPATLRVRPESAENGSSGAVENYQIVGLYGRPNEERMVFPWQLYQ